MRSSARPNVHTNPKPMFILFFIAVLFIGTVCTIPFLKAKFGLWYISKREAYIWTCRNKLPRLLVTMMDKIFLVDPEYADLNSWKHPKFAIKIEEALLNAPETCLDVTAKLQHEVGKFRNFEEKKIISIDSLLLTANYGLWTLDVTYFGHSDKVKRTPAGLYSVRYAGDTTTTRNFEFPPYGVSQTKKSGLGSVKVRNAKDPAGNDVTSRAKMSSGLKANFYRDLPDDSNVVKNFVTSGVKVLMSDGSQFVS